MARSAAPHTHVIIGDTQLRPGVPTDHLRWIGYYVADKYARRPNTTVIQLGDWYDLPSLSWYDRGKKASEGVRVKDDIAFGNDADEELVDTMLSEGADDSLTLVKLRGNHEGRLAKHYEEYPWLDGSLDRFTDEDRWDTIVPWEQSGAAGGPAVIRIDGVAYSHYFYHPNTGKPYGGANAETRLKTIGTSFTMGHQPGLLIGTRSVLGTPQWGLVLGSTYLHDEGYKGPQGNSDWRGIVVCHQVADGHYDPKLVSLDSLCQRYEGKSLAAFMKGRKR